MLIANWTSEKWRVGIGKSGLNAQATDKKQTDRVVFSLAAAAQDARLNSAAVCRVSQKQQQLKWQQPVKCCDARVLCEFVGSELEAKKTWYCQVFFSNLERKYSS